MVINTGGQPYRCPVCNGVGLVPHGFYTAVGQPHFGSTSTAPETCRSCGGTGVLWGALPPAAPSMPSLGEPPGPGYTINGIRYQLCPSCGKWEPSWHLCITGAAPETVTP